ncbi:MAG: hypothetical protein AABX70_08590 [Nanoarchaeota archaeon]
MKEADWNECLESQNALYVSSDIDKVESLIETAKKRINFCEKQTVDRSNAQFLFESYYTSSIELLHALILLKRYSVKNHLCLCYYLRDILHREDLFESFDKGRYKRNHLVYDGKQIGFESAQESIENTLELIKIIMELLEKEGLRV